MTGIPIEVFRGFYADRQKMHYRFEGFYRVTQVGSDTDI